MSWSLNVPGGTTYQGIPADQFEEAVQEAQFAPDTYNDPEIVAQWNEQLAAAKAAVLAIFHASAAFGEGGTYRASMSGHAAHNGLAERTNYTPSEFINVVVSCEPPKPASAE